MPDADATPDAQQGTADDWPPAPVLTAENDRLCAACDEPTLSIVTVSIHTGQGRKPIGGWACCMNCRATPHPTMKEADHGGS